ncbi:lipopolysaccharide biosynthesis protein [Pseudomonas sp. NPDC089530]|uniref:lipopolysaccharide biosynthesis protein n=1 Tax=Pseudomonas sp. NPDC089530 TaxID=3390651 RepID=UPI003D04A527
MSQKLTLSRYWRDVVLQASGNSVAQVIGLLGIPILARLYHPQDFALQGIFLQVVMFLTGVMTWRYEYFFQLLSNSYQARLLFVWIIKLGLFTGALLTVIAYLFGKDIATLFGAEGLGGYLLLAPLTAFSISIALGLQHNVQREGRFKDSSASEVVGKVSYVGSGLLFSPLGTIGLVVTSLFSALGKICYLRKRLFELLSVEVCKKSDQEHPRTLHSKGANAMVLSHVFSTVSGAAPIFFISYQYGVQTLGQFTMVMGTIFLPSGLLGLAIGQVFYQRAAQNFQEGKDIRFLWWETVSRLLLFGFPIYAVAVAFSGYIYPLVLGEQWESAGQYARVFSVAAFFSFISTPLDRVSLILRINIYLPLIHLLRMITAGVVMGLAVFHEYSFFEYLIGLTCQMSILYFLDMACGKFFLNKKQQAYEG